MKQLEPWRDIGLAALDALSPFARSLPKDTESVDEAFIWEPPIERRPLITFGDLRHAAAAYDSGLDGVPVADEHGPLAKCFRMGKDSERRLIAAWLRCQKVRLGIGLGYKDIGLDGLADAVERGAHEK